MRVVGTAPAATGGELPAGKYVLLERKLFAQSGKAGPTGETDDFTFEISAGAERRMELVQRRAGCADSRETVSVRVDGVRLESDLVCPPCPQASCRTSQAYSWDGQRLTVQQSFGNETNALVFKRIEP